jgi:hypothetical protein
MIGLNDPLAIPEDKRLVLDTIVWRQATLRLTERHRTTTGVETHADILGCLDLAIYVVPVFKNISVVKDGGATRERKLGQSDQRAGPRRLFRGASPNSVLSL